MSRILWQSKSKTLFDSFRNNHLSDKASGGAAYEFQAAKTLAIKHDLEFDPNAVQLPGEGLLTYFRKLNKSPAVGDVAIKQSFPIVFECRRRCPIDVGIIHHFDTEMEERSVRHRVFNSLLRRRLKGLDAVVTVSDYWRRYLEAAGCTNVHVIYNSFSPDEYIVQEELCAELLSKLSLPTDKPLIYIGNASVRKGVRAVYEQLKDLDYTLVMTGRANEVQDLPVRFFNLGYRDYLLLIKASNVAVTFSRMPEGWNRVAHEALLLGTPVVGSGSGGMRELLEGAGQLIAEDAEQLAPLVERALRENQMLAKRGSEFVRQFDDVYWRNSWETLIDTLTQ